MEKFAPEFVGWSSVFQRFRRGQKNGIGRKIMEILLKLSEYESLMVDSTFIKMQLSSAAGAKGGHQAPGRSKGATSQLH